MMITKNKFFKNVIGLRFWSYRDLKLWPLEADFTDAFLKLNIIVFLIQVNAQKLVLGGFGSREIHF